MVERRASLPTDTNADDRWQKVTLNIEIPSSYLFASVSHSAFSLHVHRCS